MEVDDESNESIMNEPRNELPRQESQKPMNNSSNLTNNDPGQMKANAIKNHLEKERRDHDELRYQEPDSESNESYIYRK